MILFRRRRGSCRQAAGHIRDQCLAVFRPHSTQPTLDSLRWVMDYIGGAHFLELLHSSPKYAEERR